ncbi:MAG: DNA polymerase III subunit alpha, partial [Planctomycetota bacterium]
TDHGNLHGALEFYKTSKKVGINPIIGYEAYVAPESRFKRGDASRAKDASYHLTLLAQNKTGFKNLVKLASMASLEGFYFKPRIDREILAAHSEGIVCLSGCVSSEFSRAILNNKDTSRAEKEAREIAGWFHNVFGDRYFIEVMNNNLEIQRLQLEGAVDIANKMGLPLVATSDAHYADKGDAEIQDVLLCINTGKFRTDTSRMKMEGDQFYLRSPEEMYQNFPGLEDAVARSQEIANTVDIDLELGKRHFPVYPLEKEQDPDNYLREVCTKGLKERYAGNEEMLPGGELSEVVQARLDRELGVIERLGFANYFLIVWDFVVHSREQGVPNTARGSGVGALVCYALYLSHVCPIKYDLLFERFLDESRLEAPDIDIDFCKERRTEIIQYVRDKYGEENVAQIGTFGTLAAKAAIKDVGRALGIPLARVNQITEMIPDELKITIEKALEKNVELKQVYEVDSEIRELLDIAKRLEGNARNVGTHAAAVVIADRPLTEYVPLGRVSGKTDIITQWSMNDVEDAGLLKMDFLGLKNLTILSKAEEIIAETTGESLDIHKFPLDDKATYELLQRGETKGVFQLESGGIRDLLQRMKPDQFTDIIATNALYRPGPLEGGMVDDFVAVKHGRKEAEYLHDVLKEILEETNGVMVYQEQVMRILNRLGGIELASAYTCIKAISKKKEAIIAQNESQFLKGSVEKGLPEKQAQELWDMILKFAGYGFNKSHSTAYALVAYQTAYLKTHYPVEFMAALLSGDIPGRNFKRKDSLVEHLEDCDRMKIEVVAPDVNLSFVDFAVREGKIRFGLSAIKGCGGSASESIVTAREKDGPFKNIFDFCERVDPSDCNRAAIETLIKAGAFDSMCENRAQNMAVVEKAIQGGAAVLADRRRGQSLLFGEEDGGDEEVAEQKLPDVPEFPEKTKLSMEKEVLGMYLSAHPMAEYQTQLSSFCSHTTTQLKDVKDRSEVIVGGMISSIKLANTRNPKPGAPSRYANFDLEDLEGAARCICWPDGYETQGHYIEAESVVIMRATVDKRGSADDVNLIANEIIPIDDASARFTAGIRINLHQEKHDETMLPKLNEVLRGYPGNMEVSVALKMDTGDTVQVVSRKHRVAITPELRGRLDDLLGEDSHALLVSPPKPSAGKGGRRGNQDN